jgi:segregation and condensation protein B
MSDELPPDPPKIPHQLALVDPLTEPEPEPEPELIELPIAPAQQTQNDNLVILPGIHPDDTLGWGVTGEEEEEDPRADLPDMNELVPPSEEMLDGVLEALLLTADSPLSVQQLNTYLAGPGVPSVRDAVHRISARLKRGGSGIRLVEVAKGWQLRTDVRTAPWVAAMRGQTPLKLSKAALETLAIVAYRQPVSRAEVEDLRGVDPGGILRMLCERSLICVAGRKDAPGRPLLYGTTSDFLGLFGLRDLSDLPTLRDLRELQADDPREGIGSTASEIEASLLDAFSLDASDEDSLSPAILPLSIPSPALAPPLPADPAD